jgi:uncharacterized protein (TIGR00251 family)
VILSEIAEPHPEGLRLRLRVAPKSGRDAVLGVHDGALKLAVTAAPEKGKANAAVIKLLSKTWRLPKSAFEILSGDTSRDKLLLVRGEADELARLRID